MRPAIVLCLIVLCSVHKTQGNLAAFLTNLPSEVGDAFEQSWLNIKSAILLGLNIVGNRQTKKLKKYPFKWLSVKLTTPYQKLRPMIITIPVLVSPRPLYQDIWRMGPLLTEKTAEKILRKPVTPLIKLRSSKTEKNKNQTRNVRFLQYAPSTSTARSKKKRSPLHEFHIDKFVIRLFYQLNIF
ncbi:uncharacterized protein LOC142975019 isoform X1 [Anticarsia gemmatalis]|uniref:uncharacterized protein LOC142975019 isoform X1 n=1 Tax=Anticarsia gemmatalis TaxID=129554 RepID=UPI003F75E2E7